MTKWEQEKYDQSAKEVERIDTEIRRLEEWRKKHIEIMWALDGRTRYLKPNSQTNREEAEGE